MKVAVVILTYNCKDLQAKLLPITLRNTPQSAEVQVIVADNDSSDGTPEYIAEQFPSVRLLRFSENYGFAEGFNKAIREIDATYHVLLSCDVEVTPGWLDPLVKTMDENPQAGACQPKVLSYNERTHFEYAGAAGGFIDKYGFPFCRGRVFSNTEEDTQQYSEDISVAWAAGCCFIVRGELYNELEGLDPDFFAHMEEIDLCWRMRAKGYQIRTNLSSSVFHIGGYKLNYAHPFKLYLNSRNNLCMLVKNWPGSVLWRRLPIRLFLDSLAAFYLLFKNGPKASLAILKGHLHFWLKLRKWLNKRKQTQRVTSLSSMDGYYNKSIIIDFFLLRRKTFKYLRWRFER